MFPSISLETIAKKWRDAIANSTAIGDFCTTNYGKVPKIYVGLDPRHKPTSSDCPYIVLGGFTKHEGLEQGTYHYAGSVGWVVYETAVASVTGQVNELQGLYHLDQLGQLIWEAIAEINPNYPLSELSYSIDMLDYVPQYAGNADIIISVPVTMGATLSY